LFDDPALGIQWPIDEPVLVDRDRQWPTLEHAGDTLFDYEDLS
jgi:dTDP-4-dehydrorhamnose 3,5-epimerase-like enzyme